MEWGKGGWGHVGVVEARNPLFGADEGTQIIKSTWLGLGMQTVGAVSDLVLRPGGNGGVPALE